MKRASNLWLTCKACGRLLTTLTRHLFAVGTVIEPVCWTCHVWAETGYIMPERRL